MNIEMPLIATIASTYNSLTHSLHCLSLSVSLSQTNIELCPECGHLKQKHILCGFCYAKVCRETGLIRQQIQAIEGGPLRAPAVETVVLYEGETPSQQDKDKRIVERARKRPAWFSYWPWDIKAAFATYLHFDVGLVRYTLIIYLTWATYVVQAVIQYMKGVDVLINGSVYFSRTYTRTLIQ